MAFEGSIDLKQELSDLLKSEGRQMFLRQKRGTQRCACWNDLTKEGDRECPRCSGFGWPYVDKKIWARIEVATQPTSGAYRNPPGAPGFSFVDEYVVYFEQTSQTNVNASVNDWIVECKTKTDGTLWPPYKIERVWDVNEVIDYRENKGQFSFYALRCRRLGLGK